MPATVSGIHLGPGTHAARPAANAAGQPIDALYSCTDHGLIYKTDGTTWSTYATLGTAGAYVAGGTDVAVADGGTGASAAAAARANLGIVIGTDVQAFDADIPTVAASQAEMEAGTEAALRSVSPLRVAQAITAQAGGGAAHAASHENGGSDEIDVTGLTGTGPGGGGVHLLDDITLHGTYGDHFDAATLDADWTTRGTVARSIYVDGATHVRNLPIQTRSDWGITRAWTPTTEAEFRMAGSSLFAEDQFGLGLWLLDSSGNGIWLGSRETSRMGIWAVTAYVIADEPSDNNSIPGKIYLSEGRKVWWSLIKKGARYHWRFSMDGETWTQSHKIAYVPSAFTPDKFGWAVGVVNTLPTHVVNVDWINVQDDFAVGNNLMITPTSGTVTPTAATTTGGAVSDVIDGVDSDEWYVVGSANPIWWMATFSVDQTMNRIRMRVRGDAWGLGYLEFEDGSEVPFFAPANGWTHVDFPTKTTGFVKIHCLRQDHGANPGFQEVEAYLAS